MSTQTPIYGDLRSLSSADIQALDNLAREELGADILVSTQLAKNLAGMSRKLNRKLGLLISRQGKIQCVVLGDAERAYLPDIGRSRAASERLRHLRFVVTSLERYEQPPEQLLSVDEMTDLLKLRLDFVVSIEVSLLGQALRSEYAHIAPTLVGVELRRQQVASVAELPTNALEICQAIEEELRLNSAKSHATARPPAILVHVNTGERDAKERVAEMGELCRTAGVEIVRVIEQRRRQVDARTLIGRGKIEEIALRALADDAEYLVFDRDLSPAQTRALSAQLPLKLIDRSQLILDIFAQRAQSLDGKLQVELAQLKYNLPKLIDQQNSLSRLTGGIGGRGPGETKLEVNRRRARDRMHALEAELKARSQHRQLQRKRRKAQAIPIFSLVGYTNAGKSTLLNALTKSEVFAENLLFATLDTTSRRLRFPRLQEVILTDTVGFIRDLPADLVAAFKATLEELQDASALLHVIDASSPQVHSQIAAVEKILKQLGLEDKTLIRILNKADLIAPDLALELSQRYDAIAISAKYQSSTLPLIEHIQQRYLGKGGASTEADADSIRVLHFEDDD